LQRPTQIIFGRNDPTVAIEGAFDLFDMIAEHQRKTELHIFNQAGHFSYREHPERFNALLGDFVDLVDRW
jgi:pimeloyl-ACP methyl ester carboxylesterase